MVGDYFSQFQGHIFQGLIPGGFAPLAAASGTRANHGVLQSFRVIEEGQARGTFGAQSPFQILDMGITLDPLYFVVFHKHPDGTTHGAHETKTENFLGHSHPFKKILPKNYGGFKADLLDFLRVKD
jgi:hypothetical protein